MTLLLKDQIKYKSDPTFLHLLIKKSQILIKKRKKSFFTKRRLLLFILE